MAFIVRNHSIFSDDEVLMCSTGSDKMRSTDTIQTVIQKLMIVRHSLQWFCGEQERIYLLVICWFGGKAIKTL